MSRSIKRSNVEPQIEELRRKIVQEQKDNGHRLKMARKCRRGFRKNVHVHHESLEVLKRESKLP
jgi:hypothetical protein